MCSILRVLSLQLGASVVTVDESLPVSTIAVVFLLSVETPLSQHVPPTQEGRWRELSEPLKMMWV